jgi:sugar phosphate isomerase/epimerase
MDLCVGVMESVLRQPRERCFAAARELGFDGVEIEVRGDLDLLRTAQGASGVAVCSLICDGKGLGEADPEGRAAARKRLAQTLVDARALGAEAVLLPQFDLTSLGDGPRVDRFVEDLRRCLPEAEQATIVIAWENALGAADTREVIERVDSPCFRCYFDFANALKRAADPVRELTSLGSLVYQVHAKNVNKQPLDAPGVDLGACLRALKERDYDGWIVLETGPGDDPLASARHNLGVVRETWRGLQ